MADGARRAGTRIQAEPFDLGLEANAFAAAQTGAGAIVTITGVIRDVASGDLAVLEIEHYPGMTERAVEAFRAEAVARFGLSDALVIHRYGPLAPHEPIMMVATAARHRADAFAGAEYLMDWLKSRAPFWKKEVSGQGADWVAARDEDESALERW